MIPRPSINKPVRTDHSRDLSPVRTADPGFTTPVQSPVSPKAPGAPTPARKRLHAPPISPGLRKFVKDEQARTNKAKRAIDANFGTTLAGTDPAIIARLEKYKKLKADGAVLFAKRMKASILQDREERIRAGKIVPRKLFEDE